MAGKYGVVELKKFLMLGAEAANVISKVIHKKGVFAAFDLVDELSALGGMSMDQVKLEISELDDADRKELIAALKAKLVLVNPQVEAKVEAGVDLIDECLHQAVAVLSLIERVKALVA